MRPCVSCRQLTAAAAAHCPHCGVALTTPPESFIDGRYQRVREVGRGAMGTVVLARDVALDRHVAIKLVAAERASEAGLVRRFYSEAAALATVRHEHVAQVYALGLHQGRPFFAMEFVEGVALDALVRAYAPPRDPPPVFRVLSVVRDVALGLAAVHAAGVVHCDVKPSNVVIETGTGRAVLVDFGIAVRLTPPPRTGAAPEGTPAYIAPEQIVPESAIVPQTDLYALACTTFELLTGHPPFRGENPMALLSQHLRDEPPKLSAADERYAPIEPVLARALAKRPDERYASAREFAQAVDALLPLFTPSEASAYAGVAAPRGPATERDSDWQPTTRTQLRVMVVDDDRAFGLLASQAVKTVFGKIPIDLVVARDGIDALERAPAAPQLMVLDQQMPGMAGTEMLALLRERPGGREMRVLVCSAAADEQALTRFRLLGVTEFCPKPMAFRVLVDALRRLALGAALLPDGPAVRG